MYRNLLITLLIILCCAACVQPVFAAGNTCVATKTGNWSDATVWSSCGGSVPGNGDTASIGAFTITVDTNTTVGTSPNDTTTIVINLTSGSSKLIVASNVTLTVQGNRQGVNGSTFQMNSGSTLVFDNSQSGGSPVYQDVNAGFTVYTFNGVSAAPVNVQAISGQSATLNANWENFSATYTVFTRMAVSATNAGGGTSGLSITHSTFDTCTNNIILNSATQNITITNNTWKNSLNSTDSIVLNNSGEATTGVRTFAYNATDKAFNDLARTLNMHDNVLGGFEGYTGAATTFSTAPINNFISNVGNTNGGNGMKFVGSWSRLYVVNPNVAGNPHFIDAYATNGNDETYATVIFESDAPDLVDQGDAFLESGGSTSGGHKIIASNVIVLPSGYPSSTVMSGTLLTLYNNTDTPVIAFHHATANVNNSSAINRLAGALAVQEAGGGASGQVVNYDSAITWGANSGTGSTGSGVVGERVNGAGQDIITPSGVTNNWVWNTLAGNNLRGYNSDNNVGTLMWTAGNASAAGVDNGQGNANPRFVASSRNVAAWNAARGYGAQTYAAGLASLQADPTRVSDLINYVQQGYIPTNLSMKTTGIGGTDPGAVTITVFNSTGAKMTLRWHRRSRAESTY